MSNYLIQGTTLSNIANAIRSKSGLSGTITPSEMSQAIVDSGQIPVNPSDPTQYDIYVLDDAGGLSYDIEVVHNYQQKTVTPSGTSIIVTADDGYEALSQVTVEGDADLVAENIKKDVNIFGVTGTYEGGSGVTETVLYERGTSYMGELTSSATADHSAIFDTDGIQLDIYSSGKGSGFATVDTIDFSEIDRLIIYFGLGGSEDSSYTHYLIVDTHGMGNKYLHVNYMGDSYPTLSAAISDSSSQYNVYYFNAMTRFSGANYIKIFKIWAEKDN